MKKATERKMIYGSLEYHLETARRIVHLQEKTNLYPLTQDTIFKNYETLATRAALVYAERRK